RYLGLHVNNNTPQDNIYDAFQTFLDSDSKTNSIDKFMFAIDRSNEELSISLIVDDAIKHQVIRYREGLYQRGNITYGKERKDLIKFFSDLANTGELQSVQEE